MKNNKKGAFELGVGTMVTIVIAVLVLVLGIVFISDIFSGASDSVNILNDKVTSKIQNLFGDEGKPIIILLGPDRTARVKANGEDFGIAFGAKIDGIVTSRNQIKYELLLDTDSQTSDCLRQDKIGNVAKVRDLFKVSFRTPKGFDAYEGNSLFAIIKVNVPEGTPSCTQKVFVEVEAINSGEFFFVEIVKGGFAFL